MVTIYNSDTLKELREAISIQQGVDALPLQISNFIQPVVEINPKLMRRNNVCKQGSLIATGSTTIYTTPADKDFFLTGIHLQTMNDAAADNATINILATLEGDASSIIFQFRKISLTAFNATQFIPLCCPIKLKRNTTIVLNSVFTVGVSVSSASITGYFIDNSGA